MSISLSEMMYGNYLDVEYLMTEREAFQKVYGFVEPFMFHEGQELKASIVTVSLKAFGKFSKTLTTYHDREKTWKITALAIKLIIHIGALVANAFAIVESTAKIGGLAATGVVFLMIKGVKKISNGSTIQAVHDKVEEFLSPLKGTALGSFKDVFNWTVRNIIANSFGLISRFLCVGLKEENPLPLRTIKQYAMFPDPKKKNDSV